MPTFDLVLEGGTVLEGSPGRAPIRADVGIRRGRIASIGDLTHERGPRRSVSGRLIAPGFIDAHSHIEALLVREGPHRAAPASMGVTTVLTGADGFGWVGLDSVLRDQLWRSTQFANGHVQPPSDASLASPEAYLSSFEGCSPLNVVAQAPHQAIRAKSMGFSTRPPTRGEIRSMATAVDEWLTAGAVGLGLGLDYAPGLSATYDELRELAILIRGADGVIASHVRYRELGRQAAWQELIALHEDTSAKVHVSHEVVDDVVQSLLDMCDSGGVDLTFESYFYPAGCTHLAMQLPLDLQALGPDGLPRTLASEDGRARVRRELGSAVAQARDAGEAITVLDTPSGRNVGTTLTDDPSSEDVLGRRALSMLEMDPSYVLCAYHRSWSDELRNEMFQATATDPRMLVASDGVYHGALGHPRGYGTTTQFLRKFVRETDTLSWAEAVYRLSGFVAQRFGIPDRGFVREGAVADLVVIDPERIRDASSWSNPFRPSVGLEATLVQGIVVWSDGQPTNALPGTVIRRGIPLTEAPVSVEPTP